MKPCITQKVSYVKLTAYIHTLHTYTTSHTAILNLDKKMLCILKSKTRHFWFSKIFPHSLTCMRMEAVFSMKSSVSNCDTLLYI